MLFLISLLMVFVSSYMLSCVAAPKNEENRLYGPAPFLYILLTMFSQVVLTFEILSLFKAINEPNVLVLNVIFLVIAGVLWFKKGKPVYIPAIKTKMTQIWTALKRDKILMIMAFGFVFLMFTVIVLDAFLPVTGGDALAYHLNRASYWMQQGSLNHFVIADDRNLVMPINSEILYLWNLLFYKTDIGLYFISFIGYIVSIFSIYNILEYFKFTQRRILWSIFILSSFASVIVELSSLETDVLIAGLVLSSITLFLNAIKERKTGMLCFSALAYALAMGTKSPAVIAFPGVFLLMTYFAYQREKKECYKPLLAYLLFLFVTFMIFSSYNYILNFIDFGNPLGSESARAVHGFRGGIKAFVANYIKYIFMLFDFSGFRYSEYVGEHIMNAREAILSFLKIPADLGVSMADDNTVNNHLYSTVSCAGILGFLVFLPSLFTSIVLSVTKRDSKKYNVISAFGVMFLINVACLSFSIAYMSFSVRFLMFLIIISAPLLAVSYIKKTNIIKLLILFFVMSYFTIISVNLIGRDFSSIWKTLKRTQTLNEAREQIRCALFDGFYGTNSYCFMRDEFITKLPQETKIALFPDYVDKTYILDLLNSHGYRIDTLMAENAPNYKYDDYDYIITTKENYIVSSLLLNMTKNVKTTYETDKSGSKAYVPKNVYFQCIYGTEKSKFFVSSQNNNEGTIINTQCYISEEFFADRGFELYRIYDFPNQNGIYKNFVRIYKNKNRNK